MGWIGKDARGGVGWMGAALAAVGALRQGNCSSAGDPAQHSDCTAPQEQRDLLPCPLAGGSPGPLLGWRDALSVVQDRAN